jgi:SAM-dependent methyltransferase
MGWFNIDGQTGARNLDYQTKGLETLRRQAIGATVLDLGCAEGLVGQWFCDGGAVLHVDGVDYSETRVAVGKGLTSDRVRLHVADLNDLTSLPPLRPKYDIVLMLAILQKLERPEVLLNFAINRARRWIAVRTPARVLDDRRSGNRPLDIPEYLRLGGFDAVQDTDGHPDDPSRCDPLAPAWLGVFERRETE